MLKLTDNVLKESKTVYTNDLTALQSDHINYGSKLNKIVVAWYNHFNKDPRKCIRGFHADKNGAGYRWHHGCGYDIFGDLFDTRELVSDTCDSIMVVSNWLETGKIEQL